MKKSFLVLLFIFITAGSFAQSGVQFMRYQTIIVDGNSAPRTNTKIGIQISIVQGSYSGTVVYVEQQCPTTDVRGVADLIVGNGSVISGDFGSIDWLNGPYYVKTETNEAGGCPFNGSGTIIVTYGLCPRGITPAAPGTPVKGKTAKGPVKKQHYVGEEYGGGIIFYVNGDTGIAEHGLIASLTDLSTGCVWSNVALTLIGPEAESTSNGKANTKAIIEQEGHTTSAALMCDTSTLDGKDDWYLPSMQELNVLWNNLYIINKALTSDGNPATVPLEQAAYWTSTEDDATTFAWYFGMYDSGNDGDTAGTSDKGELYHVRAIRSF